jgi:hypothetical protein
MNDRKRPTNNGYQPSGAERRGYQPDVGIPNDPQPQSGYTPTIGSGENPSNSPEPPDEE